LGGLCHEDGRRPGKQRFAGGVQNDFMAKERARLGDVITRSEIELKE
jgi:hypothetical protein